MKSISILSMAVISACLLQSNTARAQNYTIAIGAPNNTATITRGGSYTCTGMITVKNGATAPNGIKLIITDVQGFIYFGTGGLTPMLDPTQFTFSIAVNVPANAKPGAATCEAQLSTDGGANYTAGSATTTPTIQ